MTQRKRQEAELQLKTLLREYLEEKSGAVSSRYDFLPNFGQAHSLPVSIEETLWSGNSRTITFTRRSDLQDFVNCLLELEEEQGEYAIVTIDGLSVRVSTDSNLTPRFKSMVDEIADETRGH